MDAMDAMGAAGIPELRALCERCLREGPVGQTRAEDEPSSCLELFRRALHVRQVGAWDQLIECLTQRVQGWLRHHPYAFLALAYIPDEAYYIDGTFARLFETNAKKRLEFPTPGQAFWYLRRCLNAAIIDECRARRRDVAYEAAPALAAPPFEPGVEGEIDALELLHRLKGCTHHEREWWAVQLRLDDGLPPRTIVERFPAVFPDVTEVQRILARVLARYRRRYPRADTSGE
jgi:DNA-directed RNA polymerase specialized sigma24 family protein